MHLGGKYLLRIVFVFVTAALGAAATVADANAKSRTCRNLEMQLAAASPNSSAKARGYDRAIAKQQHQLGIVRSRLRQARCGVGIFKNRSSQCTDLRESETRMAKNLAKLQSERGRKGGASGKERARLRSALKDNNCHAKKSPQQAQRKKQKQAASSGGSKKPNRPGTVYQTMCVRACDGYYFPISFSVAKDKFSRDQKTCEARCPGAEVALYAHDVLNEEAEDMISVADGTPYRALPKAFSYRQTGVSRAACSCRKDKRFTIIAGGKAVDARTPAPIGPPPAPETRLMAKEMSSETSASFYIATPPQQEPMSDNAAAAHMEKNASVNPLLEDDAAQRRVRIVGPAFLPDPEEAIDLRAPAPAPDP
ncbi:hypothetical protein A33O_02438 [Nitratireductor aquibiodomus RA22]|uniref:DUF2865 domain-containing protein n=1 Tax=Nitratireductor aquibiodomus RA22 TaxID=1189611 RepID=I5C658_9HYPH|nr:DUF2865 domain-containing protein [Nitratireductor aquibiodomus]EIM77310.1 hypothetical protein A33O_02438 [Nitratireductor aquibiodomus RA22]